MQRVAQALPGQLPDRSVGINLDRRLQSIRGDLVDPREQKHNRKADGQQNDNQPVGPSRNLQHVKDDVYGVENEPARNEVKDPDPDNVAVFQLLKESELKGRVVAVRVPWDMRCTIVRPLGRGLNSRRRLGRRGPSGFGHLSRHFLLPKDLTSCRQDAPGVSGWQLVTYRPPLCKQAPNLE